MKVRVPLIDLRLFVRAIASLALVFFIVTPHSVSAGLITYSFTDVGILPGSTGTFAAGLNNYGHVVGRAANGSNSAAFYWSPETGILNIGQLPGGQNNFRAEGINDSGTVVGFGSVDYVDGWNGFTAFKWTAEQGMSDLGRLGAPDHPDHYSRARAINNSGVIVGDSLNFPVTWSESGGITRLNKLPGGSSAELTTIDNHGVMSGYGNATAAPGYHAAIWDGADGARLGTLPTLGDHSRAEGSNDEGHVVGYSGTPASGRHGFLWTAEDGMIDLGHVEGLVSNGTIANDINNAGTVVGTLNAFRPSNEQNAFVWTTESGMVDLNSLVQDLPTGWKLLSANAVNEWGEIVGTVSTSTGQQRAYLLSPTELAIWSIVNGTFAGGYDNWAIAGPGLVEIGVNAIAQLTAGSPASMYQKVATGSDPMLLTFDLVAQQNAGTMSLYFGDDLLGTWNGADYVDGWHSLSYSFSDPTLFNRDDMLRFTWDGETGNQAWLDNIAFNSPSPSAVPEPSSLTLFAIAGLCGVVGYRRKARLAQAAVCSDRFQE